ncbi:MAG: prepilin-type N-terminal cleavage/methylation domain-containing protein [Candidatus Firestonebacteria bacterium]
MLLKKKKLIIGFTLIELMIVVAVLGLIAAVAIPKFGELLERSREGTTKGNIGAIRSAIAVYYSDNEGKYPDDFLSFNKYLEPIPSAKATPLGNTNAITLQAGIPTSAGVGWSYDSDTGETWCNSTALDTRGVSFTSY